MNWQAAEQVAEALLYEGYLLYPYRGSALKNRFRWQFGIVAPRGYSEAGGNEPWWVQTECLLKPGAQPELALKIRFLQIEARRVERASSETNDWQPVETLTVDGQELTTWEEAAPQEWIQHGIALTRPFGDISYPLEVPGGHQEEIIRNRDGYVVARVIRERLPISCTVQVAVEADGRYRKLRIRIQNLTSWPAGSEVERARALRQSLISAHTLLGLNDAAFVSLLDPPAEAAESAAACKNLHSWPVLIGEPPARNLMLSAPIILYDYPAVAPESPGDWFDATEIDELLSLRVMTLTEEERGAAVSTDPRAAQLLERASSLPPEVLERLHGATRYYGEVTKPSPDVSAWESFLNRSGTPADQTVEVSGRPVSKGSRVRLHPGRRADAMDMFLEGQTATVAGVQRDLEDRVHIAVTVDAEQAADLHDWYGRYFYFGPEEIELLDSVAERTPRVLVAGIGNVFFGDDGFGSAVIGRLAAQSLPEWVRVKDFGIRGVHLAYELLDTSYDTTIIVDAMARGGAPGTVYVLEPDLENTPAASADAHTMGVEAVLALLKQIGGQPGRVVIVGCEPGSVDADMSLSGPVAGALDEAAAAVLNLVSVAGR